MRRLVVIGGCVTAWMASWFVIPLQLEREWYREVKKDYDAHITVPGRPPLQAPDGSFPYPIAEAVVIYCPLPGLMKARYRRVLGPLNGYGAEAWFIWTPWKVYKLWDVDGTEWLS